MRRRSSPLSGRRAAAGASSSSTIAAPAPPTETDITIEPGQRAFTITPPAGTALAPGRYVVRMQLSPKAGAVPMQTSVDVTVPEPAR